MTAPLVRNLGKFQTHVEAWLEPFEGTGYKQLLGLVMKCGGFHLGLLNPRKFTHPLS